MLSTNQIFIVRLMYDNIKYPVVVCQEQLIGLRILFRFFQLQIVKIQLQKTEADEQQSLCVSSLSSMKYVAMKRNYLRMI